jgi:hypothetical protein
MNQGAHNVRNNNLPIVDHAFRRLNDRCIQDETGCLWRRIGGSFAGYVPPEPESV